AGLYEKVQGKRLRRISIRQTEITQITQAGIRSENQTIRSKRRTFNGNQYYRVSLNNGREVAMSGFEDHQDRLKSHLHGMPPVGPAKNVAEAMADAEAAQVLKQQGGGS